MTSFILLLASFCMIFEKIRASKLKLEIDDPRPPRPSSLWVGEAPVEFASTVEEHYHQVFISSEILHWNSSGNKNNGFKSVGHQPWQCLRFLAVTYINLETQIKTLKNIVDEKQVGIKEAIKIISLLNASRKLLVSEVLKC